MLQRLRLSEHLAATGEVDAGVYLCRCGRATPSCDLQDVRAYEDIPGQFACGVCVSGKDREELEAAERARPWPTAEDMAGLRAERDRLLGLSDFAELPSALQRLGQVRVDLWIAYRQQLMAVVTDAKNGVRTPFPTRPDEEPDYDG